MTPLSYAITTTVGATFRVSVSPRTPMIYWHVQELWLGVLPVYLYQHRVKQLAAMTEPMLYNCLPPFHHDSSDDQTFPSINPLTFTPTPSPVGRCQPRLHPPSRNRKKAFKGMFINCNGLKGNAKKSSFHAAIAYHTPEFVFGCELKLDEL